MIRLVVSDVDGTMLDESERIPERICELRDLIREKDLLFTIASGREYSQVQALESVLDIQIPIVMCNGAAARHKEKFSWCDRIPGDVLERIVLLADSLDMTVVMSMASGEYAYRKTGFVEQTILQYGRFGSLFKLPEGGWDQACVQKILIINKEEKAGYPRLLCLLKELEDEICWVDYGQSVDIVPKGCTKASGIRRLAALLDIPMKDVMTLGDSYNDLEMLHEAGLGVAVNNAVSSLKKEADYTCREAYIGGVIEAIRKFC